MSTPFWKINKGGTTEVFQIGIIPKVICILSILRAPPQKMWNLDNKMKFVVNFKVMREDFTWYEYIVCICIVEIESLKMAAAPERLGWISKWFRKQFNGDFLTYSSLFFFSFFKIVCAYIKWNCGNNGILLLNYIQTASVCVCVLYMCMCVCMYVS